MVNKAFPDSWSQSTEVYARDAFLRTLDDADLRNRIVMAMPPPETLAGAYELAIRACAIVNEPSRPDEGRSRDRHYRARAVGPVADVHPRRSPIRPK